MAQQHLQFRGGLSGVALHHVRSTRMSSSRNMWREDESVDRNAGRSSEPPAPGLQLSPLENVGTTELKARGGADWRALGPHTPPGGPQHVVAGPLALRGCICGLTDMSSLCLSKGLPGRLLGHPSVCEAFRMSGLHGHQGSTWGQRQMCPLPAGPQ